MKRIYRQLACLCVLGSALVVPAGAQTTALWDSVGHILRASPTPAAGYMRFNFPRRDIPLHQGDVEVAAGLALGSWAGLAGGADSAIAMGDLVLLPAELAGVLRELDGAGIAVTAVHNHLAGEQPALTYVHFHGEGTAFSLAAAIDRALALTATPRPAGAAAPVPVTIDTARIFRVLGLRGRASGAVAQLSPVLVPGAVTAQGRTLIPALAYGSPINLQEVAAGRWVAAGDFAVLEGSVVPLLHALTSHQITAMALHSHLIGETPRVYFLHFWADGTPEAVLEGLKAALAAAGMKP